MGYFGIKIVCEEASTCDFDCPKKVPFTCYCISFPVTAYCIQLEQYIGFIKMNNKES